MPPRPRITAAVAKVLAAFLADPTADRYGLDLMRATGQPSGTLYPVLLRLTPEGAEAARTEIAALHQHLAKAQGAAMKPRPA